MGETFEPVEQANLSPLTVKIVEKSMFSETTLGTTELDLEALGLCKDKEAPVEVVNTKENGEKDVVGKLKLKVSIEGNVLFSFDQSNFYSLDTFSRTFSIYNSVKHVMSCLWLNGIKN